MKPKNKGGRPTKKEVEKRNRSRAGRPTKMTDTTLQKLEESFMLDATVEMACLQAGISKSTYHQYCKDNPAFLDRIRLLKTKLGFKAILNVANDIQQGNIQTTKWYLERKYRQDYGVNVDVTSDGAEITPVKIIDFQAIIDKHESK